MLKTSALDSATSRNLRMTRRSRREVDGESVKTFYNRVGHSNASAPTEI